MLNYKRVCSLRLERSVESFGFMYATLEIFKQSSRYCGSGIDLSLMGAQEQFYLKMKVF